MELVAVFRPEHFFGDALFMEKEDDVERRAVDDGDLCGVLDGGNNKSGLKKEKNYFTNSLTIIFSSSVSKSASFGIM